MTGIIIDVSLLVMIILFSAIGYFKGFLRSILSLLGTLGSSVVAYLARDMVAGYLNAWFGWGTIIANALMTQIVGLSASFGTEQAATPEELKTIINNSEAGLVYKKLFSAIVPTELTAPTTVADFLSKYVSNLAMIIIAFVAVFTLIKLFVFILDKILKKIPKKSAVGKVNGVLGMFVGLAKGVLFVAFALILVYFLCMIPDINTLLYPYVQQTYVTKYLYEYVGQVLL